MTEFIKTCHQEISAELSTALAGLPTLQAEEAAAMEAAEAAARVLRKAQGSIAAIPRPSALITNRLHEFEIARSSARGRQARAAGQLRVARERIAELETALRQLDQVINPVVEDAA